MAEKTVSLIELNNVTKSYKKENRIVKALDGVKLTIEQGEFTSIVGPSGSGKSTLMNLLGCLDKPDSGEYFLNGSNVNVFNDKDLSHIRNKFIGFIFQSFNLVEGMTALQNVELPLIYRQMPFAEREKASIRALEKVSMSDRLHHRPNELSGGQQQRVAIARALAAQPPLILADEPTGNLDKRSGNEVMRILHRLHESGATVVIITHDENVACSAKRRIQIVNGNVIEDEKLS